MRKDFYNICKMSQKDLKNHLVKELRVYGEPVWDDGFVYLQGSFPVLLVAHMDTVHSKLPGNIKNDNGVLSSPNGIGGDDRCGIYMILEIKKKYDCSILFCEDEESGCVGAQKFAKTDLAKELAGKFNYIIEFDRKGKNDAVFYECDNEDFEEFITEEFYKTQYGSFSDISVVAPTLGIAAVNLSCGYYNAHTKEEYVVWSEMNDSIRAAMKILARTTEKNKFEYIEAKYGKAYGYSRDYDWDCDYAFDDFFDEKYYIIEYLDEHSSYEYYEVEALTREEAIGKFCMGNEKIPYIRVVGVWTEDELYDKGAMV